MRRILRYTIPIDLAAHPVPYGPIVLAAPSRDGNVNLAEIWVGVESDSNEMMAVQVFVTDQEIPGSFIFGKSYIHNVERKRGEPVRLVWHVCYTFSPVED